jgi:eukaryotic-like serine/threonine-protein kinase
VEGRPPFNRGEAMATLMSVVSEHPAPVLRAGPLEPVLQGLLTKDPAQRSTAAAARPQLEAIADGRVPVPAPTSAQPPPPAPGPVPGGSMERIAGDDLRALASTSKALLGSVARDARDQARHLADRRRERKDRQPVAARPAPPPPRRRRFRRRWVVVPVLLTVALVLLLLVGAGLALAAVFGLL